MYQNLNFFDTHYVQAKPEDPKETYAKNKIEPALNNILASVHQRLKYNPKPSTPKIPKAIAETMPQKGPEVLMTALNGKQRKRAFGKRNIPQLQADLEIHKMQTSRHVGATSDLMSYQNQQRYREVLRQKRILENMLQEHQKLQSDRDSIACEINYMRSYLDSIRNKLDVSLRKLNSQKTLTAQSCINIATKSRPQTKSNKVLKRPAKVTPPRKQMMNTKRNETQPRIAAGGQGDGRLPSKQVVAKRDNRSSVNQGLKRKCTRQSQWVYCTKIDRKNEPKSLLVGH